MYTKNDVLQLVEWRLTLGIVKFMVFRCAMLFTSMLVCENVMRTGTWIRIHVNHR